MTTRDDDDGDDNAAALRRDAAREAALAALALTALASAVAAGLGWGAGYVLKALALFALAAVLLARGLGAHRPHARFGPGNRVTLARLVLVCLLAAVWGQPLAQPVLVAWGLVVVATIAALLDAADGPLARASGLASAFGARFDMETDALLMIVLCLLILQFDQTGAWVLAAGLMRYAFVAAAAAWPWLAAPLPPSRRRQTVCVLQIVGLIVCLGPIVPPALATAIAAATLAALGASFAVDIGWLARRRHADTAAAVTSADKPGATSAR